MSLSTIKSLLCRPLVLWALLAVLLVGGVSILVLAWFTPVSLTGTIAFTLAVSLVQAGASLWLLSVAEARHCYDEFLKPLGRRA